MENKTKLGPYRCIDEFLHFLGELIKEAERYTTDKEQDPESEHYWCARRDALYEVRQLWRETIGG